MEAALVSNRRKVPLARAVLPIGPASATLPKFAMMASVLP